MGYQNFFATRLAADIGASDTTIALETVPTETSGRLVIEARNTTQREVIKYTGVAGSTITGVTRGAGGTDAKPHTKTALVEMNLTAQDISDLYDAFQSFAATNNDWRSLVATPNTVTYNGNRSYTCVFNGVDLTDILSNGMRLRTVRTVSAPTQSASFNGTNQYFNRASGSVAGITFTDDFAGGAWFKLTNIPSLSYTIVSRTTSGAAGWALKIDSAGKLYLLGYNGASNYRMVRSLQVMQVGRWVHVVSQLDMSAFTATSTTSYILIDGKEISVEMVQNGTNPTSLVQGGDLQVGAWAGVDLMNGKVAQVFVSGKITQTQARAIYSQGLTTADVATYGIISAWTLSGASGLTDLNTTNANNLTAAGAGAGTLVTTNNDAPWTQDDAGVPSGNVDYGSVEDVTVSGGNTTVIAQVPEGNTIPTSGGISSISYATSKAPFGFPMTRMDVTSSSLCIPDYSNMSASKGAGWTVDTKGFVLIMSSVTLFSAGSLAGGVTINGKVLVNLDAGNNTSGGNGVRNSTSLVIPVKSGDIIATTGSASTTIYWMPALWV